MEGKLHLTLKIVSLTKLAKAARSQRKRVSKFDIFPSSHYQVLFFVFSILKIYSSFESFCPYC